MKKSAVAIVMVFASIHAFAGSNGTALTSGTFEDYLVRVQDNNSTCGGQLIAGKFVVTAAHCISSEWGSVYAKSDKWLSISSDGVLTSDQVSSESPNVYFGNQTYTSGTKIKVNSVTLFHDYVYMFQNGLTARSSYDESVAQQWLNDYGLTTSDVTSMPAVYGDIAVYTLETTAQQQSAAVLMTTSKGILDGSSLRWAGWGKTTQDGSASDTANAGYMSYKAYPYSSWWTQYSFNVDFETSTTKDGSMSCEGDSGTPVTIDGKVLGYVHGSTSTCGSSSSTQTFTAAWQFIPWLAEKVNSINTVSKKELKVDAAGAHTVTWTIPVQSLKVDDVTFNPQIVDSTGLFTSDDLSNCEGTFKTGESCSVTVTFNGAGSTVSSNATATLKLNDTLSIPLSYTISSSSSGGTDTGGSGSGSNSGNSGSSSGSSGGGSADWMVVLGLAGMALRRKLRR